MGQALNALAEHLEAKVSALTDTDTRLEAAFALETWKGAAGAYASGAARGPVSYSVSGRSFAFESKEAARLAMVSARADLDALLNEYGGTGLVDMGGSQW